MSNAVAIVAIVAMMLAFFVMFHENEKIIDARSEVVIQIDPPPDKQTVYTGLTLPDRNPLR